MHGPVWIELHVDDEIVSTAPERAPEAADLVRSIAALAEERGARLSFRFRQFLPATSAGRALLPSLAKAGHEVGAHAHGRSLAEVTAAIQATGVTPQAVTPGLVQAGAGGRSPLLQQCAALGYRWVTDHEHHRAWAYDGLLPRMEQGLPVLGPTVRPPDWGLMGVNGHRHLVSEEAILRLRVLERRAFQKFGSAFFGVALHEHDLCPPGLLSPSQDALDAFAGYLDARVRPSAAAAALAPPPVPRGDARPLPDAAIRFARAISIAGRLARRARPRGWRPPPAGGFRVPIGRDRYIVAERHGQELADAVVVLCPSGRQSGRRVALGPFGAGVLDVVGLGLALYTYDRSGTGASPAAGALTPGNPAHTEDWRGMLALARKEGLPVIALSWSSGVLPVLRAAAEGDAPDALIDGEGPADRWSLVPDSGNELARRDPWDDGWWVNMEPSALLPRLGVPYARLQAERDHVHGEMVEHHRRMLAAAERAGLRTWPSEVLPGQLHGHPQALLDALTWVIEAIGD